MDAAIERFMPPMAQMRTGAEGRTMVLSTSRFSNLLLICRGFRSASARVGV